MSQESFTRPPGVSDAEWESAIAQYKSESSQRQPQTKPVNRFGFTKYLGSSLAIFFGFFYFAGSLPGSTSNPGGAGLVIGPVMIIGALACRSAKWRRLEGERAPALDQQGDDLTWHKVLEALALILIAAAILFHRNLSYFIATDPVPYFQIPLWVYVAYALAGSSRSLHDVSSMRDGSPGGATLKTKWNKSSVPKFLLDSIAKTIAVVIVFTSVIFFRLWLADITSGPRAPVRVEKESVSAHFEVAGRTDGSETFEYERVE